MKQTRRCRMGSKITVMVMMLSLIPTTIGATDCTLILAGTRTVCVVRDKTGKCTATEQRLLVYCAPKLPHNLY